MGYSTKIQYIKRKSGNDQYYVNLPMALGRAMDFQAGEEVEWVVSREGHLVLVRSKSVERLSLVSQPKTNGEG
jgi:antitoxin component of MazEF toxin-antitoxin module